MKLDIGWGRRADHCGQVGPSRAGLKWADRATVLAPARAMPWVVDWKSGPAHLTSQAACIFSFYLLRLNKKIKDKVISFKI